jgi:hypothetical protein
MIPQELLINKGVNLSYFKKSFTSLTVIIGNDNGNVIPEEDTISGW